LKDSSARGFSKNESLDHRFKDSSAANGLANPLVRRRRRKRRQNRQNHGFWQAGPLENGGIRMALRPRRIAARPDPAQWGDDELLTFAEAAALLWPQGPLTASSLRTAYRAGELEVVLIARKLLVTKAGLSAMTEGARRKGRS
jgi:hypothetical protein